MRPCTQQQQRCSDSLCSMGSACARGIRSQTRQDRRAGKRRRGGEAAGATAAQTNRAPSLPRRRCSLDPIADACAAATEAKQRADAAQERAEHVGAAATSAFVGMAAARPHLIPRRRHRAGGACAAACCLRAAATASEPRGRGGKVLRRRPRTPAQHCAAGGAARRRFHVPAAAGTGLSRAARARARAWAARQNAAGTRPALLQASPSGCWTRVPSGAPTRNPRDKRRRITMQHDTHASATPGCAAAARCGCAQQRAPPLQLPWRVTRSATRWPPPPP